MTTKRHTAASAKAKPKRKIKVVKIVPFIEPDEHEVTLRVGAKTPPPIADEPLPVELPVPDIDIPDAWPAPVDYSVDHTEFVEPKKHGFWHWLLGDDSDQ